MSTIADIRKDYKLKTLSEEDIAPDAIVQFTTWWDEAVHSMIDEVNAMVLSTADASGMPDGRVVLLKGYDENGFIFFTNYLSSKGQQIAENPRACLVFFWKELERQVRISGTIEKISEKESDEYFQSRPRGSRIGAWSSPQSSIILNRESLEEDIRLYTEQFGDDPIPKPPHWGGYVVVPRVIEFWQGRPNRLHDRIRYTRDLTGWLVARLAP